MTVPLPRLSAKAAVAAAFVTGALYFLAFPGIDLWPLCFVTWVPLLFALEGRSVKQAAFLGWVSGFTMTMLGFYWLLEMLRTFSGFGTALCLVFMAILCAFQAGRIALMTALYARTVRLGWPPGAMFALAFAVSEFVYPLLFTWYFGATVHQVPALMQLAELGNPILVGLMLLSTNWAVYRLIAAKLEGRPLPLRQASLLCAVPPLAAIYGLLRIDAVDAQVAQLPTARVGVVQANMSLMGKRLDRNEGLRRHLRLTRSLHREKPLDLAVWSETSVAGAVPEDRADDFYARSFTRRLKIPTIFGAILHREVNDARRYVLFNSALTSTPNGALSGRYDKQFLLAFGEYLPLGDTFPVLYEWSPNTGKFTPGSSFKPALVDGHRLAVNICYEDISPSFINKLSREGDAELLVNLTNDAWFGDTTEPWIHLALAKFRSVEQRRYLVRSTNSGISAIVDPVGRVVDHTQAFEQAAFSSDVAYISAGGTPYRSYGDTPWWLCTLFLGYAWWRPPRSLKKPS